MSYVDGFVMVVPKKNLAAYKRLSTKAGKVWVTHGREDALVYHCRQQGLEAEPLNIQAFEEGEEGEPDAQGELSE